MNTRDFNYIYFCWMHVWSFNEVQTRFRHIEQRIADSNAIPVFVFIQEFISFSISMHDYQMLSKCIFHKMCKTPLYSFAKCKGTTVFQPFPGEICLIGIQGTQLRPPPLNQLASPLMTSMTADNSHCASFDTLSILMGKKSHPSLTGHKEQPSYHYLKMDHTS